MNIPSRLQLATEIQPGKARDPFLDQQMSQIEGAVNSVNGLLAIVSGIWAATSIISEYSASNTDTAIFADSTAGSYNVTLPALAQGSPVGKVYAIKNWQGANNVMVIAILEDLTGTQTVGTLGAGQGMIVCHGPGIIGYQIFGSA